MTSFSERGECIFKELGKTFGRSNATKTYSNGQLHWTGWDAVSPYTWQALSHDDNRYGNKHETDSHLCEQGVQLLVGIIVTALGQVGLDLLTHLLFIQVPAVIIVCARSCCWIGCTWQTVTQHYDALNAGFMHKLNKLQLVESKFDESPKTEKKQITEEPKTTFSC